MSYATPIFINAQGDREDFAQQSLKVAGPRYNTVSGKLSAPKRAELEKNGAAMKIAAVKEGFDAWQGATEVIPFAEFAHVFDDLCFDGLRSLCDFQNWGDDVVPWTEEELKIGDLTHFKKVRAAFVKNGTEIAYQRDFPAGCVVITANDDSPKRSFYKSRVRTITATKLKAVAFDYFVDFLKEPTALLAWFEKNARDAEITMFAQELCDYCRHMLCRHRNLVMFDDWQASKWHDRVRVKQTWYTDMYRALDGDDGDAEECFS